MITPRLIFRSCAAAFIGAAVYSSEAEAAKKNPVFSKTGNITSQPVGHYEFCKINQGECKAVKAAPPIKLTHTNWSKIVRVNDHVNGLIHPELDIKIYKKDEVWAFPKSRGDCEDYVLLKRKFLMADGFPASNLLITVVRLPNGDGHAVLTVRTNNGDFVLDNLDKRIMPVHQTAYTFLKRVKEDHAGKWVAIMGGNPVATAGTNGPTTPSGP